MKSAVAGMGNGAYLYINQKNQVRFELTMALKSHFEKKGVF